MFGEGYFNDRARLADLADRVIDLAKQVDADDSVLSGGALAQGLVNPFLFMTCGETSSGKSTLLNGIFAEELCGENHQREGKQGGQIQWFRHAETGEEKIKVKTELLNEHFCDLDFLQRFSLLDSPGTDTAGKELRQHLDPFFAVADLVFWVVSVENPWSGSVWDLLSQQSEQVQKKSVIVLQKKDLKHDSDLKIIEGHVRELAQQRMLYVPEIFTVSASASLHAKLQTPIDTQAWLDSGYAELEQWIEDRVSYSAPRQKMLADARAALAQVLKNIEVSVEDRAYKLQGNEQFLRDLEAEVDQERRRQSAEFAAHFEGMREVLLGQNKEARLFFRRKLGVVASLKSLLVAENTSKSIEDCLIDSIESAVAAQADIEGHSVEKKCRQHWGTVLPRVHGRLSLRLPEFDANQNAFEAIRAHFVKRMGVAARRSVMNLRIRKGLNPMMVVRSHHLKSWLYLCLLLLFLAGSAGAMQVLTPWLPLGLLLGFVLMSLFFAIRVKATARTIIRSLVSMLEDTLPPLARELERDVEEGIRHFYIEYGERLRSVRTHIADAQNDLQPQLDQRNRLYLELMIIEQDM